METRRGRPPKIVESVKEVNTSRNAVIEITLSMPNFSEYKEKIVIKDVLGKVMGAKKTPTGFMKIIKDKLNDIS